jgi:hypothetical protein
MEATETKTIGKYKIEIIPDEDAQNPRHDDNLGTMVCFHRRYNLGDKHNFSDGDDLNDFLSRNKTKIGVILPLYLYDHSGITMNTTGFSCGWDSGQVGIIFITKAKIREEYSCMRISKKLIERVTKYLVGEVETYDQYLTGDVYGFRITDTDTEEEIDSCWGFYGDEYCMNEAVSIVDFMIEKDNEKVESITL